LRGRGKGKGVVRFGGGYPMKRVGRYPKGGESLDLRPVGGGTGGARPE